jgi:hypothetical protein
VSPAQTAKEGALFGIRYHQYFKGRSFACIKAIGFKV